MKKLFILLLAFCLLLGACAAPAEDPQPEQTTVPANIMQKEDPEGDDAMNILFIGDSCTYYWTDELYGMLDAAGFQNVRVCNLYHSGCTLKMHWDWLQSNAANYEFFTVSSAGRDKVESFTLKSALEMANWDHIVLHNGTFSISQKRNEPYLENLYAYVSGQYPLSQYYWHENYVSEVGYKGSAYAITTTAERTTMAMSIHDAALEVSEKYGFPVIPTGDAWEKVRDLELIRTPVEGLGVEAFTLCSRIAGGAFKDDYGHDGDIGGGQYLNACVTFEVLTGQSCIGNTFRPKYELYGIDCSLTEERISVLQNAAHEAVAEWKQ